MKFNALLKLLAAFLCLMGLAACGQSQVSHGRHIGPQLLDIMEVRPSGLRVQHMNPASAEF